MILGKLGRPANAIYSYGGDKMGVGSRTGLTFNEVRNMEYLEDFGGVNEYGQDIYGKNVVSAFGDYEQGVKDSIEQIEKTLLNAQKKYGGLTDKYYDQTKLIRQKLKDYKGFIDKVEADDKKTEEEIKTKNLMTDVDNYLDYTVSPFGKAGAVGLDADMDVSIQDYDDAGTYTPPSSNDKAPPSKPKITKPSAPPSMGFGNPSSNNGGGGGGGTSAAGGAGAGEVLNQHLHQVQLTQVDLMAVGVGKMVV